MSARDTSRDGFGNKLEGLLLTSFRPVWAFINRTGRLGDVVNRIIINRAVLKAKPRPFAYSAKLDYTSWSSLMDQDYFGRHLPPKVIPNLPPAQVVSQLFDIQHGQQQRMSEKSTFLFASFAQWFTDGFLMTVNGNRRKTFTSHQIDLNPLYGLGDAQTRALRLCSEATGERGRLLSVVEGGEEYAETLFEPGTTTKKSKFAALPEPINLSRWPSAKPETVFAFGGDRANTTPITAALNTLFLREHNRVAGIIEQAHPKWNDDRIFETSRNVLIVLLIKLVVEEYINHISPYWFRFRANPQVAWKARWNKPNWIAGEFNLLYRWHGFVPTTFTFNGKPIPAGNLVFDNSLLTGNGLAQVFDQASRQAAGALGLFNTAPAIRMVEQKAIEQGRDSQTAPYNDYREEMGFPRVTAFNQISADPAVVAGLQKYYGHVDRIEFFVGLFAEEQRPRSAVPSLIGRMVALDAFSQALTNPLLSENVFNADTFTEQGMTIISNTRSLKDIVLRNTTATTATRVTFDQV